MRYIIFGGSGFLGTHLVNALRERKLDYLSCDMGVKENTANEMHVDIRSPDSLARIPIAAEDVVINLAANQYHEKVPANAREYFFGTNAEGCENILAWAFKRGCRKGVFFTTDMIYGKPAFLPVNEKHPQNPFGFYGQSKKLAEEIVEKFRGQGMEITIFRPRMILGPGRMGILKKLFKLLEMNLPIPLIGNGKNHYQMVSVHDCVKAVLLAVEHGCPNLNFNLGSENPPDIKTLLNNLIHEANSKSFLLPTNGPLIKAILAGFEKLGLPLMYKEQYMIADEEYILDISLAKNELGWEPQYDDAAMLRAAYNEFKKGK